MDLYLVHSPEALSNISDGWKSLELAKEKGLAKSIGVSNFTVEQLQLLENASVKPVVNQVRTLHHPRSLIKLSYSIPLQIRLHPYNIAEHAAVLAYCAAHSIIVEAYGSLHPITKSPGGPVDAVVAKLAEAHCVTPAQVLFLWVIGKGAVIVTYVDRFGSLGYLGAL